MRLDKSEDTGARVYDAPAAPAASASDLPSWLDNFDEPNDSATGPLPQWLEDDTRPPQAAPNELLGGLELPSWLRGTTQATEPAARQNVPTYLVDAAAPAEQAAQQAPASAPTRRTITRSPERLAAMEMLEQLIAAPVPEPMPAPAPVRRNRWVQIAQILAIVLVLAIVLWALLAPRFGLRLGAAPAPTTTMVAATQRLAALTPGQPVLVAFEADASRQAELRPLTTVVLEQLTAHKVPLILLSTDVQGRLLADAAADTLRAAADPFYQTLGLGLVNLGYKPGGTLALARLAQGFDSAFAQDMSGQDLRTQPTVIQNMCAVPSGQSSECRLDRLGLIVVIADEQRDAQQWVEQIHAATPAVPMLFVSPAEVGPQLRPYLTDQTLHLMSGGDDLQALTASDAVGHELDATALGAAGVGLLALIGAVPAFLAGRRQRQQGEASVWDQ